MRVGIPTEIKNNENRVAITAAGVVELVKNGHEVLIQAGAGEGSSISDDEFRTAGAKIVDSADDVWDQSDMVLKVKEPIDVKSGTTAIAYETVQTANRALPLLAPMSEVAGRLATQVGAHHLMSPVGGRGLLLGGVTATRKANVVVIGGGAAGEQAARIAYGMGAAVTVIDIALPRLKQIEDIYNGGISTMTSNALNITNALKEADLVIGSVLIPGKKAPKLVTDDMVAQMKKGSVLVDIAIDQGGCFENSRPTTHDEPTYKVHNSIYYCVANMPGAVPTTSTVALTNATLPYVVALANKGWVQALKDDESLAKGLNVHEGVITNQGVADAFPELDNKTVAEVLQSV